VLSGSVDRKKERLSYRDRQHPGFTFRIIEQLRETGCNDRNRPKSTLVPLGIPLVAGPGAIGVIVIYARQATGAFDIVFLLVVSLLVASSVWVALRFCLDLRTDDAFGRELNAAITSAIR
jgi:small neutral amino acid transporter SnatA (MarC family)